MGSALSTNPLINRRFLVLDALGRGGMGRVFRAFDRERERIVAIKTPHDPRAAGPDHPLTEEFRIASPLRHPNVVRVLDLDRVREGPLHLDSPFLVMEPFAGRPAHEALSPGRVRPEGLTRFTRDALRALAHVHDAGVVHRDLKPGNLLVHRPAGGRPRLKLTDFGLATPLGTREEPGCLSGSLPYVAPESILGGAIDERTDLYGLGVLLHYLATARMPFDDPEPREVLRWHLGGPPADPATVRDDLPDDWVRLIRAVTARDPSSRPRDARAALRMLGCVPAPRRRPASPSAETAAVRLAVDAVRLGGVRVHRHPADRAAIVRDAARRIAGIHDLGFHAVRGRRPGESGLARAITDMLASDFGDVADVVRRHGLTDGLPLEFLGNLAIRRSRGPVRATSARRATARGVIAFLLEAARRRPRVFAFAAEAMADPLVRHVVDGLDVAAREIPAPRRGAPGLLVLRPSTGRPPRCGTTRRSVEEFDDLTQPP